MSIQNALLHIKSSDEPFLLRFVRSTGKKKGSIKIVKAIYGAPAPKLRTADKSEYLKPGKRTFEKYKHKGTIPLTDVENNMLITPLISHIIGFNNFLIKH